MDREEVGHLFENYNLNSACVVDKNNKLVGMITSDDVLTVLKEEAEEDALRLAGVGDEEITDGVITKTKRRAATGTEKRERFARRRRERRRRRRLRRRIS